MKENRRYLIYLTYALAASLLLHLSTTITINLLQEPRPSFRKRYDPVTIKIIDKPETKPNPPSQKLAQASTQSNHPKSQTPDKIRAGTKPDEHQSTYSDLFPTASWSSGTISSGNPQGGAPPTVGTQKIAGHLAGQLDIPLVFRENTADSKAVAKLQKKGSEGWYFEYIDGEPVLRAVLFQAFLKKDNLDKIEELASELGKTEILFTVHQITKPALDGWKQFRDTISYSGNRIIFLRTIHTGHDGSTGMSLPDKEAERAVLRDQVALKRLMTSPAYFSPIRNRKIITE